jgi:hypothetical protein
MLGGEEILLAPGFVCDPTKLQLFSTKHKTDPNHLQRFRRAAYGTMVMTRSVERGRLATEKAPGGFASEGHPQ